MTKGQWISTFGDNLDDILQEREMTQMELALDSGISKSMISDYINKISAPSIFSIINMAYALDIDVDELVDFGDRID